MAVDELGERFAELTHPPDDPDWLEVRRLAGRARRRRSPLVLAVAAAGAAGVAVAPAFAFGLSDKLVRIFENGEPAPAPIERSVASPVVWVSAPIDAGFFGYEVPAAHWRVGSRPILLILRDADGNELRRDSSAFEVPAFRQGPSTGLAPCIVRGGGDACLKAAFGSDGVLPALRPDPDPPSKHFHGGLPWRGN